MKRATAWLICTVLLSAGFVVCSWSYAGLSHGQTKSTQRAAGQRASGQVVLLGKVFCSLKQPAINFFPGMVTDVAVSSGDKVRKGQVLATYRLQPRTKLDILRRLDPGRISDLQLGLAEMGHKLAKLKKKRDSLRKLKSQDLLAADSLPEIQTTIVLLAQRRQVYQHRLELARQVKAKEKAILEQKLGVAVAGGQAPEQARVLAEMDGVVVWVNPMLRPGAFLPKPTALFQVGVMEPMLIRAQVHEIEAMRLKIGDTARVNIEALQGRKFEARLSRMDWAPADMHPQRPTYYTVEFEVANPDLVLREGLKCRLVLGGN